MFVVVVFSVVATVLELLADNPELDGMFVVVVFCKMVALSAALLGVVVVDSISSAITK